MRSIVRAASTAALGTLALSLFAAPASITAPAVSLVADTGSSQAQQVLALVNAERAEAGCGPVRLDDRLSTAATAHSRNMATKDFFSHVGLDGSTFVTRIEKAGYPAPRSENIAAGLTSAQATVRQWMNSSSHRKKLILIEIDNSRKNTCSILNGSFKMCRKITFGNLPAD